MNELKLYHGNVLIGVISNIAPEDNYEMNGNIKLTPEFDKYRGVFSYLLANDGLTPGGDVPFDESYFVGWFLQDEAGVLSAIDIPAIDKDEIIWRE